MTLPIINPELQDIVNKTVEYLEARKRGEPPEPDAVREHLQRIRYYGQSIRAARKLWSGPSVQFVGSGPIALRVVLHEGRASVVFLHPDRRAAHRRLTELMAADPPLRLAGPPKIVDLRPRIGDAPLK